MVNFAIEKEFSVNEAEEPLASEEDLTEKLSIDDYVVGENNSSFYEGLLTITTTPLERILNYSGFDLTHLLEELGRDDTYNTAGTVDPYSHEVYQNQPEEEASSPENQKDTVAYFIERTLDYINPTLETDAINDSREDGDDVCRIAKRWQYEVQNSHIGAEISLYREQCAALQSVFD